MSNEHTKPEATDGDRGLARLIFEVSETTDPFSEAHLVNLIASHVAARLAPFEAERDVLAKELQLWKKLALEADECREAAEAERDALRATVAKMREALELAKSSSDRATNYLNHRL